MAHPIQQAVSSSIHDTFAQSREIRGPPDSLSGTTEEAVLEAVGLEGVNVLRFVTCTPLGDNVLCRADIVGDLSMIVDTSSRSRSKGC
jgi:hypothetical protein